MSENTANRNRARRRVVRQAGPPVEGDGAGIEVQTPAAGVAPPASADVEAEAEAVESISAASVDSDAVPADGTVDAASAGDDAVGSASVAEPDVAKAPAAEDDSSQVNDAVVADDAAESDAESEPKSKLRRLTGGLGRVGTIAAVVALISTLVLIGSGGVFFYHQHRADALSQRRAEYLQVAKQAYINMATVNNATAGQDIDRLLSVAGGSLKDEYKENRDAYQKIFEQLKVQSSGKVIAAAIESDTADTASVLLLAQQTVSNTATNGPMQRDYRVRVHLTRSGDSVTASSVEFVP
ncbi:hypothetical protein ACWDNI_04330 [Nocardia niigatensis]